MAFNLPLMNKTRTSLPKFLATLPPGNYTAILRGISNTTGADAVEFYNMK